MTREEFVNIVASKWWNRNLRNKKKYPKYLHDFWRAYAEIAIPRLELYTPQRQAAFLAQVAHEAHYFQTLEEYASGTAYEGREDLGNTVPGDGRRFKGRGYIQLTGRSNYRTFTKWFKKIEPLAPDFERQPELIASCAELAMWATVYFWETRRLNQWSDKGYFKTQTRRINGGLNGYADRLNAHALFWPLVENQDFTQYENYA